MVDNDWLGSVFKSLINAIVTSNNIVNNFNVMFGKKFFLSDSFTIGWFRSNNGMMTDSRFSLFERFRSMGERELLKLQHRTKESDFGLFISVSIFHKQIWLAHRSSSNLKKIELE